MIRAPVFSILHFVEQLLHSFIWTLSATSTSIVCLCVALEISWCQGYRKPMGWSPASRLLLVTVGESSLYNKKLKSFWTFLVYSLILSNRINSFLICTKNSSNSQLVNIPAYLPAFWNSGIANLDLILIMISKCSNTKQTFTRRNESWSRKENERRDAGYWRNASLITILITWWAQNDDWKSRHTI